jgi:hypothetical protein
MTRTRPARGVLAKRKPASKPSKPSTKPPKPRTGKCKPPTEALLKAAWAKCRELEGKIKQAREEAKADETVALSTQLDEIANALGWPLVHADFYSLETAINAVRAAVRKPRDMLRHMAVFVFGSVVEPFDEDELIARLKKWCDAHRGLRAENDRLVAEHAETNKTQDAWMVQKLREVEDGYKTALATRTGIEEALKIERDNALHEAAKLRDQLYKMATTPLSPLEYDAALEALKVERDNALRELAELRDQIETKTRLWAPPSNLLSRYVDSDPSISDVQPDGRTSHHVLPSGRSYSVATGGGLPPQFSKPCAADKVYHWPPLPSAVQLVGAPHDVQHDDSGPPVSDPLLPLMPAIDDSHQATSSTVIATETAHWLDQVAAGERQMAANKFRIEHENDMAAQRAWEARQSTERPQAATDEMSDTALPFDESTPFLKANNP